MVSVLSKPSSERMNSKRVSESLIRVGAIFCGVILFGFVLLWIFASSLIEDGAADCRSLKMLLQDPAKGGADL